MAFEAYLSIKGVPGESTDDKHKDWIEVTAYSMGLGQPSSVTHSSAGGAAAGKVSFQDMTCTHLIDMASPKLFEMCSSGKHISDATLELCRAGGTKFKYLEIKLENVLITNLKTDDAKAAMEFPTEIISLNFGKMKMTYFKQGDKGTGSGQVAAGWDQTKNSSY
jgi:type VI secretion system secreted protein Hcp